MKFQFLTQSDTPFESDGEPQNGDDVCGAVLFGDGVVFDGCGNTDLWEIDYPENQNRNAARCVKRQRMKVCCLCPMPKNKGGNQTKYLQKRRSASYGRGKT